MFETLAKALYPQTPTQSIFCIGIFIYIWRSGWRNQNRAVRIISKGYVYALVGFPIFLICLGAIIGTLRSMGINVQVGFPLLAALIIFLVTAIPLFDKARRFMTSSSKSINGN